MKTNQFRALILILLMTVISWGAANAQSFIVKGIVTDAGNGEVVAGYSVVVDGVQNGTITNADSAYPIRANRGVALVFSFTGYHAQEIKMASACLDVALETDTQQLEGCVVIGYGIETQKMTCRAAPIAMNHSLLYNAEMSAEECRVVRENGFKKIWDNPLSTFSIDVDIVSYNNMCRFLNKGGLPPTDVIHTKELIDYFPYSYAQPTGSDPVRITSGIDTCLWDEQYRLIRVGLKAKEIPTENLPTSSLIFLIDVSDSMYGPEHPDLVKSSLKLLINNPRDKDEVIVVVYPGAAGEKPVSTPGSDKQKVREAVDELEIGGSTARGEGIELAYKIARKNFITGGNSHIILCTNSDFNMGISSDQELKKLIEQKRKSGVFLTVLGCGMGNYKDSKMQTLAERGNGNHAYINNLQEASQVLVNEFGATLHTVAKNIKLQMEFNPTQTQAYRLIGYESRLLADEDFNDDTEDAGEMGAGHTITTFYEVIPVGVRGDSTGKVDDLRYQKKQKTATSANNSSESLTVKLRYKTPDGNTSKKIEQALADSRNNRVSADFRFAAAVAMFGQLLRDFGFRGNANYDKVISLARTGLENDEKGYRKEFMRLVETAKGI